MEYGAEQFSTEMIRNETLQQIADEIGADNLLKVARIVGGRTFYLPQADTLLVPLRNMKIKQEFNGGNYVELAEKYGLTERWVRELCKDLVEPRPLKPPPAEQLSFF